MKKKISYEGLEFTPSPYQEKIFENILHGTSNMVINAVAGSGKTTTIVNALNLIPKKQKVLFIAFNKDIVENLKKKSGEPENVHITTYHSLGYAILSENVREKVELDEYKYQSKVRTDISALCEEVPNLPHSIYMTFLRNIEKLIDYSRFNLCQSEREIKVIAEKYNVLLVANECEVVENALKWGRNTLKTVDYTDMVWLPYELGFSTKKHLYNWIFVDEAQDSSPVQQELFKKCFKRGARFCAVGDDSQCINAWAGADTEAFKNFLNIPNTKEFSLPISYRCPVTVIRMAQKFVPNIEAKEGAEFGEVKWNVDPYSPKPGDMVICRNTFPLVKLYTEYLRINKKSYIEGKDIGNSLIDTIRKHSGVGKTYLNKTLVSDGLFRNLYKHFFKLVEVMMNKSNLTIDEAYFSAPVMEFYDTIQTLEVLSEGLTDTEELIAKINTVFSEGKTEAVRLSTIHKAKGLEADNVFILCKSLMPSIYAKQEWEILSERNLEYVAITRAKRTLQYIDEDKFRIERGKQFNSELKKKFDIIKTLLDVPIQSRKTNVTVTVKGKNPMKVVTGKTEEEKSKRKSVGALKFGSLLKK